MNKEQVINEFRAAGALLEGHFVLSSGLHSDTYLQCARVMMESHRAEILCKALADKIREESDQKFSLIVSPAMGGILVGYELGRQLGVPAIFTERVNGEFTLRRGFGIPSGIKVLMAEDVITTGKSSSECIKCIQKLGGVVVAATCLIDRSDGSVNFDLPLISLAQLSVPVYSAESLPTDLARIPAVKPGSRGLE